MNCPKCGKQMKVTHTYPVRGQGATHRRECTCGTVVTTKTVVVNINPGKGEGAFSLAKTLRSKAGAQAESED